MKIDLRDIPVVWINLDSATENAKLMQERFAKYGFKKYA
jgi:predicted amino acid racemase